MVHRALKVLYLFKKNYLFNYFFLGLDTEMKQMWTGHWGGDIWVTGSLQRKQEVRNVCKSIGLASQNIESVRNTGGWS